MKNVKWMNIAHRCSITLYQWVCVLKCLGCALLSTREKLIFSIAESCSDASHYFGHSHFCMMNANPNGKTIFKVLWKQIRLCIKCIIDYYTDTFAIRLSSLEALFCRNCLSLPPLIIFCVVLKSLVDLNVQRTLYPSMWWGELSEIALSKRC